MNELYRSANVVVRCVPTDDQTRWVVTFDNYGIGHGFDRPGFGEAWLQSQGISAIHVLGKREDWYQYPEMTEAMAAIRRVVSGADRVMTYGSSMGGYAAIRFADAAGANAVLALSPQYSIQPDVKPFEVRWRQDAQRIEWLAGASGKIHCGCVPVVAYDPETVDAAHVDLIEQDISIIRVRAPHSAHPSTTYFAEVGLLKSLVLDVLSGVLDVSAMEVEVRRRRKTSVVYQGEIIERQRSRRPGIALALARAWAPRSKNHPYALLTLAKQLSLAGEHREALAVHLQVLEIGGRSADYLVGYGHTLVALGEVQEAREVAHEVISQLSHLAHIHAWAAEVFGAAGYRAEALDAAETAAGLDRANRYYRQLVMKYRYGEGAAALWQWINRLRRRLVLGAAGAAKGLRPLPLTSRAER